MQIIWNYTCFQKYAVANLQNDTFQKLLRLKFLVFAIFREQFIQRQLEYLK